MKKRRFLIPSLLVAGLPVNQGDAVPPNDETADVPKSPPLYDIFKIEHEYSLAAHSSHRSHSSHGSHRSSSGGSAPSQAAPTPNRQSTPPSSILPVAPSTVPQKTLPGTSAKFFDIVRRVQAALYAYGYYSGAYDGVVGPETRAAISKFQKDWSLPITGTVTPELLNALQIPAK